MKLLLIGDIYGQTGRRMVQKFLPGLRQEHRPDYVIANGENVSGGRGLSKKHRDLLMACGVDVFTTGNHVFARLDWTDLLAETPAAPSPEMKAPVLRPHNIGGDAIPGRGCILLRPLNRPPLAVLNLAGRVYMDRAECPFLWADRLLAQLPADVPKILDFHAEATSEKMALAWYLDGRVSFLAGTHTHVQTSDERILPEGTGFITDLGMTGPRNGILGVDREIIIHRFRYGYSDRFVNAEGPGVIEGVVVELGPDGKTETVSRLRVQE